MRRGNTTFLYTTLRHDIPSFCPFRKFVEISVDLLTFFLLLRVSSINQVAKIYIYFSTNVRFFEKKGEMWPFLSFAAVRTCGVEWQQLKITGFD